MKNIAYLILLSTILLLVSGLSFWIGKQTTEMEKSQLVEGVVLNALGNTLLNLRYFDSNQMAEAQRLMQAETNGQLSWLINLDGANDNPEFLKSKCKVLNTLKQYREKHQLFKTPDWNDLWKLPGAKEEEAKRVEFLSSLPCGKELFFSVD